MAKPGRGHGCGFRYPGIRAMIAALLLAIAQQSAEGCAPVAIQQQVSAAADALARNDLATAKTVIASAAACPVENAPAYYAHVLRAEIAAKESDWPTVQSMLGNVTFHPELKISPRAATFLLRADKALNDTKAFAAHRTGIIAGNDWMLSAIGKKIETFRAGKATVVAYEANVPQDALHRALEFIIIPDDPQDYPRSVLLTDDVGAAQIQAELKLPAGHVWFVDGYDCRGHTTLEMLPPSAEQPGYAAVKAIVIKSIEGKASGVSSTELPNGEMCTTISWILPGLGATRPPAVNP